METTRQSTLRTWITGIILWSVVLAVGSQDPRNHDGATDHCKNKGGLAIPDEDRGSEIPYWLPLKRYRRDDFIWNDGSCISVTAEDQSEQCGALDIERGGLRPISCSGTRWHICQYPDPSDKTDIQVTVCAQQFSLRSSANNWYAANSSCVFEGGHLAILADPSSQRKVIDWIKNEGRQITKATIFYVGFRQTDWVFNGNHGLHYDIKTWPWDNGEPASEHDCAVAVTVGDKYSWKTEDCQQEHLYKCKELRKSDEL